MQFGQSFQRMGSIIGRNEPAPAQNQERAEDKRGEVAADLFSNDVDFNNLVQFLVPICSNDGSIPQILRDNDAYATRLYEEWELDIMFALDPGYSVPLFKMN